MKPGRKSKEIAKAEIFDRESAEGRTFIEFINPDAAITNMKNVPDGAYLVAAPLVRFKEDGRITKISDIPLGYYI